MVKFACDDERPAFLCSDECKAKDSILHDVTVHTCGDLLVSLTPCRDTSTDIWYQLSSSKLPAEVVDSCVHYPQKYSGQTIRVQTEGAASGPIWVQTCLEEQNTIMVQTHRIVPYCDLPAVPTFLDQAQPRPSRSPNHEPIPVVLDHPWS